ncbi:hypothetical protein GCM10010387_33300 [Streptomyces inusitatus]|uniref:Uncharacterized protein n=1 Tax=Streptomyces inusitatus TaxID=68221 RepID=A0A918UV87_9ACTN|nr:hypothetical protein GCM10010387_33300 [Streptomyces inusitatus]
MTQGPVPGSPSTAAHRLDARPSGLLDFSEGRVRGGEGGGLLPVGRRAVASAEHARTDAPPVRAPTADSPSRPRHGLVTVQRQRHRRTLAADTVSVMRLRLLTVGLTAAALLTLAAVGDRTPATPEQREG